MLSGQIYFVWKDLSRKLFWTFEQNVNQKGVEEINRRRWERQIHKQISGWERVNIEVFERINTGLVKRVCLVKTSHFLQLFLVTSQVCEEKGHLLCSRKGNMLDWIYFDYFCRPVTSFLETVGYTAGVGVQVGFGMGMGAGGSAKSWNGGQFAHLAQ